MFTAEVNSTNESDIDLLMGTKTPGADNLIGAKEEVKNNETQEQVKDQPKTKLPDKSVIQEKNTNPEEDVDLMLGGDEGPEEDTEEPKQKKTTSKTESKKQEAPKRTLGDDVEIDYQVIYQKMVDDGIWEEVQVPEGTEWDKDTFLEIQKLQADAKYEDLLSRTGSYGKAIIEFEQNGGNPSEMLNLFREQRDIQQFDVSTNDGQEEFLSAYYASQGYSDKSIERTIKSLRDQGGTVLQEESEEKKAIWDQQYNEAIQVRQQEQALYAKQVEDSKRNFHNTMVQTITSDAEVTPKERRDLQSYILDYNQPYKGNQVSQFYIDMAEVQKDPKNYIELAKFVKGLKTGEYTKKVADKVKKETSAASFLKIKNGAALKTSSGAPDLESQGGSSFVQLLSRKK